MSYRHLEPPEKQTNVPPEQRRWRGLWLLRSTEMTIDDHMEPFLDYTFFYGYAYLVRDMTKVDWARLAFNEINFLYWVTNGVHFCITTDDKNAAIENLTTTLLGYLLLIKGVFFMVNKKEMMIMLDYMRAFHYKVMEEKKYDKILKTYWLYARLLSKFFSFGALGLSLSFLVTTFFTHDLPLAAAAYGFEDKKYYIHNYCAQIWVVMVAGFIIPAVEGFCLYQLLFMYAMMEIFIVKCEDMKNPKFRLKEWVESEGETEEYYSDKQLAMLDCVKLKEHLNDALAFQQDIYWFSQVYHEGQKFQTFTIMSFSAVVGCVSLFQIMEGTGKTSELLRFYLYLILVIFIIYCYCLFGNIILNKSLEMSDIVYEIPWYLFDDPLKKSILLMIFRAQKAIVINGVFFNVDLALFTSVAKTTYSYYTIMSNQEE